MWYSSVLTESGRSGRGTYRQTAGCALIGKRFKEKRMSRDVCMAVLFVFITAASMAWAGSPRFVLAPPEETAQGGTVVVLDLYLHNHSDDAMVYEFPTLISLRLKTDRTTLSVDADLVDPDLSPRTQIPGRGFAKRQYALALPVFAAGAVRLEPETLTANSLTLWVARAAPEAWGGQQVPLDEGPTLVQSFIDKLSVYKPMYFLLGIDPGLEQSKFQFSFQYRLFNPDGFLAQQAPWIGGFHLGYTQRAIWDLKDESIPFEDTSYMPELFYLVPKIDLQMDRVSAFGIQGGVQHESNGEGGDDSRSTNYLYVKPIMGIHLAGPYHLKVAPKVFTIFANEDETNPDLVDYIGYVDLELGVFNPGGLALNSHLRWARRGATVQLDLSYPMTRLLSRNLNLYLQAQYFSGYAETLIRYNERSNAFRLGVAIVR
jgi:outer membrane phospholipase A